MQPAAAAYRHHYTTLHYTPLHRVLLVTWSITCNTVWCSGAVVVLYCRNRDLMVNYPELSASVWYGNSSKLNRLRHGWLVLVGS